MARIRLDSEEASWLALAVQEEPFTMDSQIYKTYKRELFSTDALNILNCMAGLPAPYSRKILKAVEDLRKWRSQL